MRNWRQIASSLSLIILIISIVVIAGYASGVPFLYGSHTIPMALLTAIAVAVINLDILSISEFGAWALTLLYGHGDFRTRRARLTRPLKGPAFVLLMLIAAV